MNRATRSAASKRKLRSRHRHAAIDVQRLARHVTRLLRGEIDTGGADILAAVSFHGLFDPPGLPPEKIAAKVVAFHGWDDPMVTPDKVVALGQELTEAGSDWQIHAYGHVGHGFTNPHASNLQIDGVAYNELAAERSWTSFINLLEELFG